MMTVVALFRSTHPGPSMLVTAITVVLGISVGLDLARVALLGAAVLVQQFSVGLSNDWIDAERDREAGRTDKPIAAGVISVGLARAVSLGLATLAIALTIPLGWAATLAHLGFMGAGWAYNAGVKSTPFSVVAYVVGFGLLPFVVTLALPTPALPAPWAVAAAALLGVSAHFANALPDLDDDRRHGVRGTPQLAGLRASVATISLALVAGGSFVVVGSGAFDVPRLVGLGLVVVVAGVCWWLGVSRAPSRLLFQLIMAAALVIVVLLAFSGRNLVA